MPTTAAVLAAMIALAPPPDGELQRYELIAQTVADVAAEDADRSRTGWAADELAAILVVTARYESTFRRRVHSGEIRGDRGRSVCLMQIHRSARPVGRRHAWVTLAGLDAAATRRCIETGADHYEHHERACGRSFGCALARYQGHRSRRNPETQKRLRAFWRVLGMLRRAGD